MILVRRASRFAWLLSIVLLAAPLAGQTALAGPSEALPRAALVGGRISPCLNVHESPNAGSGTLECLEPGLALTLLGSSEGWSQVRLNDGRQGWVTTRFLVIARLPRPTGRNDDDPLAEEVQKLRTLATDLQQQLEASRQAEIALREQLVASRAETEELRLVLTTAAAPAVEPPVGEHRVAVRPPMATTPDGPARVETPSPADEVPTLAPVSEPFVPVDTDVVAPIVDEAAAVEELPTQDELRNLVTAWASAWASQRVDDYLSLYSPAFEPAGGEDRSAWEAQRRQRVTAPDYIAIGVESIDILPADAEGNTEVRFLQTYETGTYQDQVLKSLVFAVEDGAWLIRSEVVLEVISGP